MGAYLFNDCWTILKRSRIAAYKRFRIVQVQGLCLFFAKNLALCVGCRLPTANTNSQSINVVNLKIALKCCFSCKIENFTTNGFEKQFVQQTLFTAHSYTIKKQCKEKGLYKQPLRRGNNFCAQKKVNITLSPKKKICFVGKYTYKQKSQGKTAAVIHNLYWGFW